MTATRSDKKRVKQRPDEKSMLVIPVIDVRGEQAVAAQRGDRARYRPLETPLAESADPVDVANGLARLFPFPVLYVADLDGIENGNPDAATQSRLADAWPGSEIWIDDGGRSLDPLLRRQMLVSGLDSVADVDLPPTLALPTRGRGPVASHASDVVPPPLWGRLGGGDTQPSRLTLSYVLGSESLTSLQDYEHVRQHAGPHAPLSLDFRGDAFLGPPELLADAAHWPSRIIVMTLARVGSSEGPDLVRLADIIARAGERSVFAAGGVRNVDDLRALRDIGAAGALIATALHNGAITRRDLDALHAAD